MLGTDQVSPLGRRRASSSQVHAATGDGSSGATTWGGGSLNVSKRTALGASGADSPMDASKRTVLGGSGVCDRTDALSEAVATFGGTQRHTASHRVLKELLDDDMKGLHALAQRKTRWCLRSLSHPALPSGGRSELPHMASFVAAARSRTKDSDGLLVQGPPLQAVLTLGREADALRAAAVEARHPLTTDVATELCTGGASLDWVNVEALTRELEEARGQASSLASPASAPAPAPASQLAGGAASWGAYQPLRSRNWPTMATFEQHYHLPDHLRAPAKAVGSGPKYQALTRTRKTIASLGEAANYGPTTGTTMLRPKTPQPELHARAREGPRRAIITDAGGYYRQACSELSLEPLDTMPLFSKQLVHLNVVVASTRQCYAIAAAIQACMPEELVCTDAHLTDMGCQKIVETAMSGGELRRLRISGSCLHFRTCLAFEAALRAPPAGASLTELSLAACGLGGDLGPDEARELPGGAEEAYGRCRAALLGGEAAAGGGGGAGGRGGEGSTVQTDSDAGRPEECTSGGDEQQTQEVEFATPVALPLLAQLARAGCSVRRLDLSKTALSIATVQCLSRALRTSPLEALILNECSMTDESMAALAGGLQENSQLLELRLRGNQLSGLPQGAAPLLDAAGRHGRLAHLDLAENELAKENVEELLALLKWSLSLVAVHFLGMHVDSDVAMHIGACCRQWVTENDPDAAAAAATALAAPEAGSMSEEGRSQTLDLPEPPQEMVICRTLHVPELSTWLVVVPAAKPTQTPKRSSTAVAAPKKEAVLRSWMPSCCWVCSCCAAVEYQWVVPDSGLGSDTGTKATRMFVRPSFADFARIELKRRRASGAKRVHFGVSLLAPPGKHVHIYESEQGHTRELLTAESEAGVDIAEASLTEAQRHSLEQLCRLRRYNGQLHATPEVRSEGFQIPEQAAEPEGPEEADPWSEEPARHRRLRQCFEADLQDMRMVDLCLADEEEEVKQTFWELYGPFYYEVYAIYAGRSQWPLIRQVDIYGFFDDARLLDRGEVEAGTGGEQRLGISDVNQIILRTTASRKKLLRDPSSRRGSEVLQRTEEGQPINRPQFLEVLTRAAIILRGQTPSTASALRRFADRILGERILQVPLTPFPRRLASLPGEYIDTLLARRKTLREAWERFGGSNSAFQALAQLLKLCDSEFTAKHVSSIYALSRRPAVECKRKPRRQPSLRYDEFCEALSRLGQCWQRAKSSGSEGQRFPPQMQRGKPIRQKVLAARLEAFFAKLEERMRPSFVPNV